METSTRTSALGLSEALEFLVGLGKGQQVIKKFHDLDYSNLPMQPILPPAADALVFTTLGSFADFANLTNRGIEREELIVHIESPFVVSLVGKLREASRERESYATARFDQNQIFEFGKFMNAEDFIIRLQQAFDASENHCYDVLALVGNMTAEKVVIANDDGVSQKVGARAGVVLQGGGAQIKNPYYLACHRTFAEITQPVSPFILRVRQNGDEVPLAALFESDNGAWKYRAMESIKTFLAAEIEDIPILA